MKKCITLGNWNKNYLYIIAIVISVNIYILISGGGYHIYMIGLFIDEDHIGHVYIHKLIYYLLILICSFLYSLYDKKRNNKNNNKIESDNDLNKNSTKIALKYY